MRVWRETEAFEGGEGAGERGERPEEEEEGGRFRWVVGGGGRGGD